MIQFMKRTLASLVLAAYVLTSSCSSRQQQPETPETPATLEQKANENFPISLFQELNSEYTNAFSKAWGIYRNIVHIDNNLDQRKAYEKAIIPFEDLLKLREGDAKDYDALATCYLRTGRLEQAKKSIDIAIRKDPYQKAYRTTLWLINNPK